MNAYKLHIALSYATLAEDGGWTSTDGDAHIKLQAAEEEKSLLHDEIGRVEVCSSEYLTYVHKLYLLTVLFNTVGRVEARSCKSQAGGISGVCSTLVHYLSSGSIKCRVYRFSYICSCLTS